MRASHDPELIHTFILGVAAGISAPLYEAVSTTGSLSAPNRGDEGLGCFLARAIVNQQLSNKAARAIWNRVETAASLAGSTIPEFFGTDCSEDLRACGVSANKTKALRSLYAAAHEGMLCSESLRELDHEARSRQLLSIWGIGQWTCDMVSIFYFGCPDIWPEGDATVQKTFRGLIGRQDPHKTAKLFAPYRSHLALAMWATNDSP